MTSLVHAGEADRWGGWDWREPRYGCFFRTCSYCGSIHPDDLAADTSWHAGWADRKYGWPHKFYVDDLANREPNTLFVLSAGNSTRHMPDGAIRAVDLKRKHWKILKAENWQSGTTGDGWVQFGSRATLFAKCYTVHLADPEISDEVKDSIAQRCGLRFEFLPDGRIRWSPVGASS